MKIDIVLQAASDPLVLSVYILDYISVSKYFIMRRIMGLWLEL